MKYTLLELVQMAANSISSDEVNSINDTVESRGLAEMARTVYFDIITRADLPEHYSLVNLTASGDILKPVVMTVPDDVDEILWVEYDVQTVDDPVITMRKITHLELEDFLHLQYSLDLGSATVSTFTEVVGTNTFTIPYATDIAPKYYTSFDDHTLIFDSYDAAIDTTLQSSKTLCKARLSIPFTMSDSFVPDMDDAQFQLFVNELKSMAWAEYKQAQHAKAEMNAKRQWTRLQKTMYEVEHLSSFDRLPNYGRK